MCRSYPSINICGELFTWTHCLVCDGEYFQCTHIISQPGSLFWTQKSVEKLMDKEWEQESPNCPVAGVAARLHSQTVKRICVATLVMGPRCDGGSCATEASGAAVRYSNLSHVLLARPASMLFHYNCGEGGHKMIRIAQSFGKRLTTFCSFIYYKAPCLPLVTLNMFSQSTKWFNVFYIILQIALWNLFFAVCHAFIEYIICGVCIHVVHTCCTMHVVLSFLYKQYINVSQNSVLLLITCTLNAYRGWLNGSSWALILNLNNCTQRWIHICDSPFLNHVWRFICLLQKKSLCMLTSACCFLLSWSTMKTAGSCILDTDGLDNELSVWRCQKKKLWLSDKPLCL